MKSHIGCELLRSSIDNEIPLLSVVNEAPTSYECRHLCDLLKVSTAETLFTYKDEFYAGTPAVTKNNYGDGMSYYIGSDADQSFYNDFYNKLLQEAEVLPLVDGAIPEDITISSRKSESTEYVFIQNYANNNTDISSIKIDGEIIYGGADKEMKPYSTIIYKR